MSSVTGIKKIVQFLHHKASLFSPPQLLQIHSQLLTTGLLSFNPLFLFPLLELYLSTSSTLSHATTIFHQIQEPNSLKWRLMMRRHASQSYPLKALSLFQEMLIATDPGTRIRDPFIYASLVKACNTLQAVKQGKSVHCYAVKLDLDKNVYVLNSLIYFYLNSGNLINYARVLFDGMPEKTVVTFNCMVSGYVKTWLFNVGLDLFIRVLRGAFGQNPKPNSVTLVILLSGCVQFGEFVVGNSLHSYNFLDSSYRTPEKEAAIRIL